MGSITTPVLATAHRRLGPSERFLLNVATRQRPRQPVGSDSPIGRVLLGAGVGHDLVFPDTNESMIVTGIFKGGPDTNPVV